MVEGQKQFKILLDRIKNRTLTTKIRIHSIYIYSVNVFKELVSASGKTLAPFCSH